MTLLSLQLFGPGTIRYHDEVLRPHSVKALGLLAYLAVEATRRHSRTRLSRMLWDAESEAAARRNLRQALYSLRTLADGRLQEVLHVDADGVMFVPNASIDVDLARFLERVRSADVASWQAAASLYCAPLLEDRAFEACDEFDAWLTSTRETVHALAMQNLDRLAAHAISRERWQEAVAHAQALCRFDPASESAVRHLFRIHAACGDVPSIDAQWHRLCDLLHRDFASEPTLETAQIYHRLRSHAAQPGCADEMQMVSAKQPAQQPIMRSGVADLEAFIRAGKAAERVYGFNQALDLYERALNILEKSPAANAERLGEVLLLKEAVLERLGRRTEQRAVIDQALDIAAQSNDAARSAAVHLRLAGVCAYLGQHAQAKAAATHSLCIFRELDDMPGEAEALRELGFVDWHGQDYPAALAHARAALALHRRLGDVAGEASALHNLAEIHRGLGSPRQAIAWYEQAIQCHWAAGHVIGEILSLFGTANALHQAGEERAAVDKYREALALSERHGERTMQTRALHALSIQHLSRMELDLARDFAVRAIEIDRAIGYAHALGFDLVDLAHIHSVRRERAQAHAALQEALVWFEFTLDDEAIRSTQARLLELESGCEPQSAPPSRSGVKSHLALGEGKIYCEFESPLARESRSELTR